MNKFIREVSVSLLSERLAEETCVELAVTDPKAYVERFKTVEREDGSKDVVFYVRDRGDWGVAGNYIGVDFVFRTGSKTPIPALSGRLLGHVYSRDGRGSWYLFARKTGDAPKRALFVPPRDSSEQEMPSPRASSASNALSGASRARQAPTLPPKARTDGEL